MKQVAEPRWKPSSTAHTHWELASTLAELSNDSERQELLYPFSGEETDEQRSEMTRTNNHRAVMQLRHEMGLSPRVHTREYRYNSVTEGRQ